MNCEPTPGGNEWADVRPAPSTCLVGVHTEWDPLEEVIVGIAAGARIPSPDRGVHAVDYAEIYPAPEDVPAGPYPNSVVEEATEDLEEFVAVLRSHGVVVRRPELTDHSARFGTPRWSADGEYNYCPRDVLLTIGDTVIETPMVLRTRFFEPFAYKAILLEYFESGANWISAPKPLLPDETYNLRPDSGSVLNNFEPLFDAANVLRVGQDLLYLVSSSANKLGARWLQRVLGRGYTVHLLEGIYDGTHLDTTISLVRPGLVVLNPERVKLHQLPPMFKKWDIIWCPPLRDEHPQASKLRATTWISMNFFMINPELAVVDRCQTRLIAELGSRGVEVVPLAMRQSRLLSGGFHCVTLDVRRRGRLEDYA